MKWGNVSHHYWCCHIYYYILYNEKADEKPKKKPNRTVATLPLDSAMDYKYINSSLVCTSVVQKSTRTPPSQLWHLLCLYDLFLFHLPNSYHTPYLRHSAKLRWRKNERAQHISWGCIISLTPLLLPPITPSGTPTSLTSTPTFYNLRLWLIPTFKQLWCLNNSDVLRRFYDFRPMTTMKTMTHLLMPRARHGYGKTRRFSKTGSAVSYHEMVS